MGPIGHAGTTSALLFAAGLAVLGALPSRRCWQEAQEEEDDAAQGAGEEPLGRAQDPQGTRDGAPGAQHPPHQHR